MIRLDIPSGETLVIENIILDFNGTLARCGEISETVKSLLEQLSQTVNIYVATADTRGNAREACSGLPLEILELPGEMPLDAAKLHVLEKLGCDVTAAFGNGRNDTLMLAKAALGVCIISVEGAHPATIMTASVVIDSIENALKLLTEPERLIATLRN